MEKNSEYMDVLVRWDVKDLVSRDLILYSLSDDQLGFNLLLKDELGNGIQVSFESVFSYRNTDESYLLSLWHNTPKEVLGNVFYLMENSSYIALFHNMTLNLYSEWKIQHFCIYTIEDCVDVLSPKEPRIIYL